MNARGVLQLAMLVASILLLAAVPVSSQAQMNCTDCHSIHDSPGGTLNTATEFDLICESCHGPAGTAIFTDRHVDPDFNQASGNTGKPAWEIGCISCHTPHETDAVNHLYNNGVQHAHTLGNDLGNLVDGINIKLFGRNEDGTGIAKIATPLRINSVGATGPCTNSNTEVEVFLPPFAAGEGPPVTIMVGDRITINNGGAEFDGAFRVKETNWDGIQDSPPTGWVCFDRSTTAAYSPTGFVSSAGWHNRPTIKTAEWSAGTATLSLNDGYSIRIGDNIDVFDVGEVNPGTFNGIKTVIAVTSTNVTAASWAVDTATLTLAENHLYQVGESIVVTDVISSGPGSFNGRFTVTVVNGLDVSYALATDPGTFTNNGSVATPVRSRVAYAASDPGVSNLGAGGQIEYLASIKSVENMVVVTPPGPSPYLVTGLVFTAGNRPNKADTVVLTLDRAHPFLTNDVFTVTGISSLGGTGDEFNGTWTVTDVPNANELEYKNVWDPNPGSYISGGEIPDPAAPSPVLEITLPNDDAGINQFQAASSGVRDGDIITVFEVVPDEYNGRWEVESVALPVVNVRCPPYSRTALAKPACSLAGLPAYVEGGNIQSTGTMRPVVFESRGTDNNDPDFLSDFTHSFANTDEDEDGWKDGPCEICHTQTSKHLNDDFGDSHNNGRTCGASCHTHSTGFDKDSPFCPPGRTCPPVN